MSINGMTGEEDDPTYLPQADPKAPANQNTGVNGGRPNAPGVQTFGGSSDNSPPPGPAPGVGHDGSQNGLSREQYRDAWMSSGVKDMAGLRAWTAQHGGNVLSDNGTVQTPYGEQLDMLIGARTGNGQAGWTAGAGMQGANTGPGGPGAAGAGAGAAGSPGAASDPNSFQGQIRAMLLQQMQQNGKPVDMNDPQIAGEMNAQRTVLERQRQERRAAMAERNAASGLNSGGAGSGAMDADIASGYEDMGHQLTGIQAQLFTRELTRKQTALNQQMQMALQTGDAESARALQLQMQGVDAELRRQQMSQQQSQWNDQFGLNASQALYGRDRDAMLYGSGN